MGPVRLQWRCLKSALGRYGLELLNAFELSEHVWWNEYYACLEKLISNADDTLVQSEINEINEFKKNPEKCRSIYDVLKRIRSLDFQFS